MRKNMGNLDRGVRLVAAAVVAILYFTDVIGGVLAIVLMVLALVFILTSLVSYCPLYTPFGWSTFKRREQQP
jgi:hypothetical protein